MSVNKESQITNNLKLLSFLLALPIGFMMYKAHVSTQVKLPESNLEARNPVNIDVNSKRSIASVKPMKLQPSKSLFKNRSKPSTFYVSINASNTSVLQLDENFTVTADISPTTPLENVHYKWNLPEGVSAVNANLEGELGSLTPGEANNLSIDLKNESFGDKVIRLEIYTKDTPVKFVNVSYFKTNSNVKDTINALSKDKGYKIPEGSKIFR